MHKENPNEEIIGIIHEDNPATKHIKEKETVLFKNELRACRRHTFLYTAPFVLCVGIMIGTNLKTIIGWIK